MAYEDEKKGELETLLNDILEDKNTNLTPENLKKGVTVLGIDGNYIGTDTSDATATNEDVLEGKTAYAQGQKLTGTLRVEDVDSVLDMFPSIETEISEEIDIKDAVENSFNDLSIYGNSRQESTEGYNLFDYLNNIRNTSGNNITVEKDDKMGYITVNGIPNVNYANIVDGFNITDLLEDKQTYTLKQENANNLSINYVYSQIIIDNKETLQKQYIGTRTTFNQTFTVDKTTYNYYANIQTGTIENTGTLNNFKTRFMIYKGTDDKPFELYTGGKASPNPDYPQEIESIKDSITFKRIGKNIISINEKVGSGKQQLIINTDNSSKALQPFKLKKGDKVTVSYKMSNIQILNNSFLCTRKGNMSYNYPFNGTTGTITITNDIDYIGLVVYLTEVVDSNFKIYDIQIEKGTEATEYEPYHEDVYTINLNTDLSSINILSKQLEYNYVDEDGNKYLCDVIDFKNKKIIKYLNKIILPKENITWTQNKDETDFFEIANYTILNDYQAKGDLTISNYFRDDRYKSNYIVTSKSTVFIRFPKSSGIDTLQKAQEFMDTHDVEVLYVLANPKEIALTDEELSYLEQFPLQKGINHIFSDDELSPKFKLKYYRDINMMLESEIINNAESKFNIFYDSKVEEFNTNADEKLKGYNTNADNKLEKYNTNATSKINEYDTNADEKLEGYNTNATSKTNEYNTNANEKLEEFNNNATEKTTAYNDNAEDKLNEYNTNATNKINEYNTNAEAILKILPKTETEVLEEIDIDDSAESSFNKLNVFGNSRQESTTGAAKVDFGVFAGDYSDEQMEIKIDENGIISLKGTVSSYYSKKIGTLTKDMFSAGNNIYYARGNNTNSGLIFIQTIGSISFTSNNNSPSFEITDESQESDLYIVVNYLESGTLNVNEILYPMISLESNALYEPYTGGNPSPNPDYPQEIESIKDSITFKRIGKNYFNSEIEMGGYTAAGIKYASNTRVRSVNSFILKPGTYTISCPAATAMAINSAYGNKEQTIYDNDVLTITLEEKQDCVLTVETTDLLNAKIQIEKGTEATEYEPYHEDVYTLPVQQNMYALVEGQEDCFVKKDGKWYERHYSFEGELTEENYYVDKPDTRLAIYNMNTYGFSTGVYNGKTKQYLNYFKFYNNWDARGSFIAGNTLWFSGFPDKETFKEFIKTKKEEGNPIKIVYIRGEENGSILYPLDLECTPEQVEVLNQLEQFSLEKGINHIYSDDELSPKFKLMYYQDMNILLDKINKNIADVSAQLIEGGSNV